MDISVIDVSSKAKGDKREAGFDMQTEYEQQGVLEIKTILFPLLKYIKAELVK